MQKLGSGQLIDREKLKKELKGDEAKKIICKGIPCIDGNCIDKSYDMDGDIMDLVSHALRCF
jgi:hypothetical protein